MESDIDPPADATDGATPGAAAKTAAVPTADPTSAPMPGPEGVVRVLVVDDQPLIRRGLALTLGAEPGLQIVGQAADGEEAIALARQLRPDVVLMDLKMPKLGGVAATRAITGELPTTQVVVLTTYDTDELVFDAIRAGAQAYLLKDASEEVVIDTIRAVCRGESRLEPQIARKVMEEFRRTPRQADSAAEPAAGAAGDRGGGKSAEMTTEAMSAPPAEAAEDGEPINRREERVLELIAQGLSNKEIARAMSLAEGTVKNYTSRIMNKLHARSRTELAVKALRRRQS